MDLNYVTSDFGPINTGIDTGMVGYEFLLWSIVKDQPEDVIFFYTVPTTDIF